MLKTELKTGFVFYTSLDKQHRFRPQNSDMPPFGLPCPISSLLPFQIRLANTAFYNGIKSFKLFDTDGTMVKNLSGDIGKIETNATIDLDYRYFTYKGITLASALPKGYYYIQLIIDMPEIFGVERLLSFYSEVIEIQDVSGFLKLEWWNSSDIDPLLYHTGFKNCIYLDTYTEAMPPAFIQEGDNNSEGEYIPSYHRMVHKHRVESFLPDYLQDALAMLPMHDNVEITEGSETLKISQIKATMDYGENYIGSGKLEFELPFKYIKTSCATNILLAP